MTYPIPNFNGCTVEVWDWMNNFIPHFTMTVITYPCWNESYFISVKWAKFHENFFSNTVTLLDLSEAPFSDRDELDQQLDYHYDDVITGTIASQITSLTVVYSIVYSDADQRKHQSSASLAFVQGIHRRPVNSPHKWPVTRKTFSFDDVIMQQLDYGMYE